MPFFLEANLHIDMRLCEILFLTNNIFLMFFDDVFFFKQSLFQ